MFWVFLPMFPLLIFLVGRYLVANGGGALFARWMTHVHVSTPEPMPLVRVQERFLAANAFESLRAAQRAAAAVVDGPASARAGALNGDNFARTRGFALSFNREGVGEALLGPGLRDVTAGGDCCS